MFPRLSLFARAGVALSSVALSLGWPGVSSGQLSPDEAARAIVPADGLRVQVFAHEPQLYAPTAIDVDERGRVWVVEGVNYRKAGGPRIDQPPYFPDPLRKTGDRIVVLEDTDGDGRCDTSRVFYQGLDINSPQGFAVFGGKVWVSQSPSIRTIEIRPDGTAGRIETFLTGFGGIHGDHSVHSVYLGPDGRLYGCFGNTHTVLSLPDGRKIDNWTSAVKGGVVFRMNLDATGFEVLGDNFRNGYECATDSFGTTFYSDNDDDEGNLYCRFVYVMPGGNFGHQPQPPRGLDWNMERAGVIPILMRTGGGAPAGLCVYEGNLLPDRCRGMPLLAETGTGELLGFRLSPDGAGYRVDGAALDADGRQTIHTLRETRKPDVLLRSDDRWFRPSDVCAAPDGSVFVADFYNRIAGGRQLDDELRGRIYRIVPSGHDGSYRPFRLDVATEEGFAAALASPNLAARAAAVLKAREIGDRVRPILERLLASNDPRLAARALYLIAELGDVGRSRARQTLRHKNADLRVAAVRAIALNGRPSLDDLKPIVRDPSPHVRREVLLALRGGTDATGLREVLVELALQYDGYDRFYLEAVLLATAGNVRASVRDAIVKAVENRADRTAAGLLWALDPVKALPRFTQIADSAQRPLEERIVAAEALALFEPQAAGEALLKVIAADTPPQLALPALRGLARNVETRWKALAKSPGLLEAVQPWTALDATRDDALKLAKALGTRPLVHWRLSPVYPAPAAEGFEKVFPPEEAAVPEASGEWVAARVSAAGVVDLAAQRKPSSNAVAYAVTLLDAAVPVETRLLAGSDDGLKVWLNGKLIHAHDATRGVAPRQDVVPLTIPAGLNRLLVKVNQGTGGWGFAAEIEDPFAALTEVPAEEAAQLADPKDRLNPKRLPPDAELLAIPGDAARGRAVFLRASTACAKCHAVGGLGAKSTRLGPALDGIGKKMGPDGLLEAIVRPDAKIAPQWVTWTIATTDGKVHSGLVAEETPDRIALVDPAGRRTIIPRSGIEDRKPQDTSIMPQLLVGNLTPQELADLLAFLDRESEGR